MNEDQLIRFITESGGNIAGLLLAFYLFAKQVIKGLTGSAAQMAEKIERIAASIEKLNEKMVIVVERTEWHKKALDNYDKRLSNLEQHKSKGA